MRRDIVRFPVGPQFKKILEDDHEWHVITDMRLNPIMMRRGNKMSIDLKTREIAYSFLISKMQPGTIRRVYDLHTHPISHGPPSTGDMSVFIREKLKDPYKEGFDVYNKQGVIIAGYGVITKHGIWLIKLPEDKQKLEYLDQVGGTLYALKVQKHLKNKLSQLPKGSLDKFYADLNESPEGNLDKFYADLNSSPVLKKVNNSAHEKAFKELVKGEPDIKTTIVRRTHRFNMRRRR